MRCSPVPPSLLLFADELSRAPQVFVLLALVRFEVVPLQAQIPDDDGLSLRLNVARLLALCPRAELAMPESDITLVISHCYN